MRSLRERVWELVGDEGGTSTVEYAMLLALVAVACISGWVALGADLRNVINRASNAISQPLS